MLWLNVAQTPERPRPRSLRGWWHWFWERRVPAVMPVVSPREELSDQHMADAIRDRYRLEAHTRRLQEAVAVLRAERDAFQERDE